MATADSKQYIITYLDKGQYGIEITSIDNIIVMQKITRVPRAQTYFMGVINLRGEIVPVMSLRAKFGIAEAPYTNKSRIIIVRPEPQAALVGLIVDEVKEVITLDNSNIEKMLYDESDSKGNYSFGVGKYESELINLLNIPAIVIEKEVTA
jgi:purine-binding chemotaxis protein CheW